MLRVLFIYVLSTLLRLFAIHLPAYQSPRHILASPLTLQTDCSGREERPSTNPIRFYGDGTVDACYRATVQRMKVKAMAA